MPGKISVATYLFRRLRQQGVEAIHGVPGDFTLRAIDQLKGAGIKWVGTCNELNAGYAADGYARIKGLGALLTTFGVGELSAINAVATSSSEHVPVVHIVGVPKADALISQGPGPLIHHGFPDRPNGIFARMHRSITAAQCVIQTPEDSCSWIDSTIASALQHHRPVYIHLPTDAVDIMVPDSGLATPLQTSFTGDKIHERTETFAMDLIKKLEQAVFPLLLVDRSRDLDTARKELNQFVRHSRIPTITMPSGASMIDHDIPNYLGVHSGPVGQIDTMPLIEQADLIIAFGTMFSDTQTLGWKTVPPASKTIEIPNFIVWKDYRPPKPFEAMNTKPLLTLLNERLRPADLRIHKSPPKMLRKFPDFRLLPEPESTSSDSPITQSSFYTRINPYLKPHDIILLGNATPILGGRDFVLPSPTNRVICSGLSFSIGHMLPAALGAAIAQQQSVSASLYTNDVETSARGRVVLFDGDGSFQVTAQELSTIIRLRLNVTIFIMNNDGYAYERLIHGMNEDYNDIAPWDYLSLPAAFGGREALKQAAAEGEEYGISCACLKTWGNLDDFLADERFDNGFDGAARRGLKLVDVRVGRADVPERFRQVFEQAGEGLRRKTEEGFVNNDTKKIEKERPTKIVKASKEKERATKTVEKSREKEKATQTVELRKEKDAEEPTMDNGDPGPLPISYFYKGTRLKPGRDATREGWPRRYEVPLVGAGSVIIEDPREDAIDITRNPAEKSWAQNSEQVSDDESDEEDGSEIFIESSKFGRIDVSEYLERDGNEKDKDTSEVERALTKSKEEKEAEWKAGKEEKLRVKKEEKKEKKEVGAEREEDGKKDMLEEVSESEVEAENENGNESESENDSATKPKWDWSKVVVRTGPIKNGTKDSLGRDVKPGEVKGKGTHLWEGRGRQKSKDWNYSDAVADAGDDLDGHGGGDETDTRKGRAGGSLVRRTQRRFDEGNRVRITDGYSTINLKLPGLGKR